MMKELRYDFYIGATPDKVWEHLISPAYTKQIYYGSVIRSSFKVGELLEYIGPGADGDNTLHVYGEILEFSPQKALRFTHQVGPSYLKGGDNYKSRISWLLEPVGGSTKLTLIHDNWDLDDPSYAGSDTAWPQIMSNTKTLIETGKTLDLGSWQ